MSSLSQRIHAALPQTQCTRCGYPDCAAYAQAIATEQVPINQCPPGGAQGIERLSAITGQAILPLNPERGAEGPRKTVFIDEAWCIGCTLCIKVCPTDAIVGSNKKMHSVLEAYCTGCELCLPVCPVDCIEIEPVDVGLGGWAAWSQDEADQALQRYTRRKARLDALQVAAGIDSTDSQPASGLTETVPGTGIAASGAGAAAKSQRQALIEAALAKARARGPS